METAILSDQYKELLEENHQYKELVSQQKDHLVFLNRELSAAKSEIQEKSIVPGGLLKQQAKHSQHRKHVRILENKLHQDTLKFNKLLCSNMDCREDIAHLLNEKDKGCNIEEKLNGQMATEQSFMEKLEESLTLALRQRSDAETQMREERESIEVETAHFATRQRNLKTVIYHEAKLCNFMETKLQECIPLEDDEDFKMRKKQQQYESGVKKLEMYMQGHSTLLEVTGEKELAHITQMYVLTEQKNLAHVTYVNELHNRSNMLQSSISKTKSEILCLEQDRKGHEEQSESKLKDLKSELEMYSSLADSLEKQCTEIQRTLDRLKSALNSLLHEIVHEAAVLTSDNIEYLTSVLEETISNLLIQANEVDEEMELPPRDLLLANSDLLPECEAAVETDLGPLRAMSKSA